jgi:DNA-binding CsgD family transcriptional regulator
LGGYWLAKGKTAKALRYIQKADSYYSLHEDQEFMARIETLDLTNRIMEDQKKLWRTLALSGALVILLLVAISLILRKMDRLRKEKEGADAVIDEALEENQDSEGLLTEREEQILPLIASGMTSPQIADKVCLSLATIKWYRKKLMIKLDAANTAELVSKAKEKGLI